MDKVLTSEIQKDSLVRRFLEKFIKNSKMDWGVIELTESVINNDTKK